MSVRSSRLAGDCARSTASKGGLGLGTGVLAGSSTGSGSTKSGTSPQAQSGQHWAGLQNILPNDNDDTLPKNADKTQTEMKAIQRGANYWINP